MEVELFVNLKVCPFSYQLITKLLKIHKMDDAIIYLQGYLLGNPVTFKDHEDDYKIPFAYGMGLISDELYEVGFSLGVIFVHSD